MNLFQEAKKLIEESQNIYILPSKDNQNESIPSSLALFYSLRKLKKNVNLIVEEFPEKLRFLIPSLDFISEPKNFVISIPSSKAEVSQIQYEKNEKNLKIYLTLNKGNIKKNDISFSFNIPKPNLLITVGNKELPPRQYFDAGTSILNIDNQRGNKNFGRINLIKNDSSLTEIITNFLKSTNNGLIEKNIATCLLAGIILSSENFQDQKTSFETFETAAFLTKKGALYQQIINSLYPHTRASFGAGVYKNV